MTNRKKSNLRNITLSADKDLIELARRRAAASKTTINNEFRNWLLQFTNSKRDERWYSDFMKQFEEVDSGGKFSREDFYK